MARYTRGTLTGSNAPVNTETQKIEQAINDTLSRKGDQPNSMEAPLDMNSNRVLNLPAPIGDTEPLRNIDGKQYVTAAADSAAEAKASEEAAELSQIAAAGSAVSAAESAAAAAQFPEGQLSIALAQEGDEKGADLIADVPFVRSHLKEFATTPMVDGRRYTNAGFYTGTTVGGGDWVYDASRPKTEHNVGTVVDPDRLAVWDGTQGDLATLYTAAVSGVGCLVRVGVERITPEMVGVVEGLTDFNHTALDKLVKTDWPVDWGGKQYGVKSPIGSGQLKSGAIEWVSSGCEIYLDPSVAQQTHLLWYQVLPMHHNIVGKITFNANLKSPTAVLLENRASGSYPTAYGSFYAKDMATINVRRASTSDAGGSGFRLDGAFTTVVLDQPVARDCFLAAGAGVSGSIGISGIVITTDSTSGLGPQFVQINQPDIANIESEDLSYTADQDGIQVFNNAGSLWGAFEINGGVFENCFGRSIKSQMSSGKVTGTHFKRSRGFTGGIGNEEISAQRGFVSARDITFEYNDFVPSVVISGRIGSINGSSSAIDSINGVVTGSNPLPAVVSTFSANPMPAVNVSNINVIGDVTRIVKFRTPTINAVLNLNNVEANNVLSDLVEVTVGGISPVVGASAIVNISNCVNKGADVPLVTHNVPGSGAIANVTTSGFIRGFTGDTDRITPASSNPAVRTVVKRLTGDYSSGGFRQLISGTLPATTTIELDVIGAAQVGQLDIVVNFTRNAYAKIAYDSSGITEIYSGTLITVGNTSEPASGTFRVWLDTVNDKILIKSTEGSSRNYTAEYFVPG